MFVGEICNRQVVICGRDDSIQNAAELMRDNHVGDVIVVEHKEGKHFPIGILTDRDIVIEVLAEGVNLNDIVVNDVMSSELISVKEDDYIIETIEQMRDRGIRRVPVVNQEGSLEGILAVDDAIELVAELLSNLVRLFKHEFNREIKTR
ncbi:MAG: CBS domain-containing protein [Gammaproteobacteria bacterium]|nr:CBS domain-containing protein [Gammaproteobacteria bacterium]